MPGNWLIWKDGGLKTHRYWDVPEPGNTAEAYSEDDLVVEFDGLFRQAVADRLMSDVPLGVFLSGGIDSSAIAAVMAEQMSTPVQTFSVGFESGYYNELEFARDVASAIGADHHEVVLDSEGAFAELPKLIWHEDEPIRFSASVPLFVVSKLASQHVKVVLSGEGSDELFAGLRKVLGDAFSISSGGRVSPPHSQLDTRAACRQYPPKWPLPQSVRTKISHTFLNYHATRRYHF